VPSDFTRSDWIVYDPDNEPAFEAKLNQALDAVEASASFEEGLLDIALDARSIDCAVAIERAVKAFLLCGESRIIDKAEQITARIAGADANDSIADLERLRGELAMFIRLARASTP
jgi:hypothetical protein